MSNELWMLIGVGLGGLVFLIVRLWYRRRLAAKLADDLLRDVVKGKDAFRR